MKDRGIGNSTDDQAELNSSLCNIRFEKKISIGLKKCRGKMNNQQAALTLQPLGSTDKRYRKGLILFY